MGMSRHSSIGKASKIEVQKARQFSDKLQCFLENCKNVHDESMNGEKQQQTLVNEISKMQENSEEIELGLFNFLD